MGCGSSKGSEPAVCPQNIRPMKQAAVATQIEGCEASSDKRLSKEHETALRKAGSQAHFERAGDVKPSETQPASSSIGKEATEDFPRKSADATLQVPPTNTWLGNTTDHLDSADAANPARAAFRARLQNENGPSSPQNFKSTRSLNRSIGVRRRGSGETDQGRWCAADEKEAEAATDPLLEEFERNKEANPILVRKATGNGILSSRGAERSSKSSKRLAVGFTMYTPPPSQLVAVDDDGAMDVPTGAEQWQQR